jgi:hypothetical protein
VKTFVGAGDPELPEGWKLYPNPAKNYVVIDLGDGPDLATPVSFGLYDLSGKKLLETVLHDAATEISLRGLGLDAGIYVIRLSDTAGMETLYTGKLIIR